MVWAYMQNVRILSNIFHAHIWDIPDHGQSLVIFQFNSKLDWSKFCSTHLAHGFEKWLFSEWFLQSQIRTSICIFSCHAHLAESILLDETLQNSSIFHKPTEWDICWWQFQSFLYHDVSSSGYGHQCLLHYELRKGKCIHWKKLR